MACAFGSVASSVGWAAVAAGAAVVCEVPWCAGVDGAGGHEADGFGADGPAGVDDGAPAFPFELVFVAVALFSCGGHGLARCLPVRELDAGGDDEPGLGLPGVVDELFADLLCD